MTFECSQCGDCCTHLGLVHSIEEDYGNLRYRLKNQYTGERTDVCVDPDKIALFSDRSTFIDRPEACPFFRFHEGKGYCCVHTTRPLICRDYGCWRILIKNSKGERVGRIMGYRHLATDDPDLRRLFEESSGGRKGQSDHLWDEMVIGMLRSAGYIVRI